MEQVNCWNNCNKMNRNLFDFVSWVSKNIIAAFVKFRLSNSGCQIKLKNVRERKPIIQRWFQYTKEIYDQSDNFCGESFEMTFKFNLIFKAVSFIISSYIRIFYTWPWSNLNTYLLSCFMFECDSCRAIDNETNGQIAAKVSTLSHTRQGKLQTFKKPQYCRLSIKTPKNYTTFCEGDMHLIF